MTSSIVFTITLSLHDALPILCKCEPQPLPRFGVQQSRSLAGSHEREEVVAERRTSLPGHTRAKGQARQRHSYLSTRDRKSTRLYSSHVAISYAVFCLKKKNNI